MNGVSLRHFLKNVASLLINANLANSTNVTFILAKWFCDKEFNQVQHLILGVLTSAYGNHIRIIVLSRKLGG
jgi:hypothetical protein